MPNGDPDFEALLEFLRDSRGFDFTGYKRPSLMRRVQRRMDQVGIESFSDYTDHLAVTPDEFTALFDTILINVTAFFRDPDAWEHLRQTVLPELLAARGPEAPIRVWSAGCATGEEAYSIAALLADLLEPEAFRNRVKIYATDVDESALAAARAAVYGEREMRDVPPEVRARHFEPVNGRWVFRSDLRRCVIFGRNELVADAPISRVDLLVCRNTLMYFTADTQSRILQRFHFALAEDGVLFLGKAEMLLSHGTLFTPLDLRRRFFRKVSRPPGVAPLTRGAELRPDPSTELGRLHQQAVLVSPVATLLIGLDGRLAAMNGRAETMFGLPRQVVGRAFRDLEVAYRPVPLGPSVEQALTERRPVWLRDVEFTRGVDDRVILDLLIAPLLGAGGEPLGTAVSAMDVTRVRELQDNLDTVNRQLETAYEELQSTVEELETTNEELQSTVEELETTNEELQSTNEELETMNEEMATTNDELRTINDELRERTDELHETTDYMHAILASLHSAVIVVDRDFGVRTWNTRAEDLWGLRAEEVVGSHLLGLDIGLPTETLKPMVRRLLADEPGGGLQLEAVNRRGRTVTIRVVGSGLRDGQGRTTGAVLVLDEVSDGAAAKASERH